MLRAAQVVLEEGLARPILIGRPAVIEARLERFGLSIRPGRDFELINPEDDPRYRDYVADLCRARRPQGHHARCGAHAGAHQHDGHRARWRVQRGDADAMICGLEGRFMRASAPHPRHHRARPGVTDFAALSLVITAKGVYFLADTQVKPTRPPRRSPRWRSLAAAHVARFGIEPKIALLSHSDFGSYDTPVGAQDARGAGVILRGTRPNWRSTARCTATSALSERCASACYPARALKGEANVLIMPNLDAANIAYQLIKVLADALPVGPILIGAAQAGAYPDALGDGARRRQHDGGGRGGGPVAGAAGVGGSPLPRQGSQPQPGRGALLHHLAAEAEQGGGRPLGGDGLARRLHQRGVLHHAPEILLVQVRAGDRLYRALQRGQREGRRQQLEHDGAVFQLAAQAADSAVAMMRRWSNIMRSPRLGRLAAQCRARPSRRASGSRPAS